jgi:hypothetical protein
VLHNEFETSLEYVARPSLKKPNQNKTKTIVNVLNEELLKAISLKQAENVELKLPFTLASHKFKKSRNKQ